MRGLITCIAGPTVTVNTPGLRLYDRVAVGERRLAGEVIRIERGQAVVQVYETTRGIAIGEPAEGLEAPLTVTLGPGLLGDIYDGLQRPLSRLREVYGAFIPAGGELPALAMERLWEFNATRKRGESIAPHECVGHFLEGGFRHPVFVPDGVRGVLAEVATGPIRLDKAVACLENGASILPVRQWPVREPRPVRRRLDLHTPLVTGQRVIDFFFPIALGGVAIFPGGFGTGKTVLEQAIARLSDADVVVYVGCGERGNEMADMLCEFGDLTDPWTGRPLSARTIMVVNTSNMPVAAREASVFTGVTLAEYYRDMGYNVLFLADSISRWAEAMREISSAMEEMPGEEGYPTYLASRVASLFARAGVVETLGGGQGTLSLILSVSPPGGDITEPVTQACLRASGAFLNLDAKLAHRRHYPAINWLLSYSLYDQSMLSFFRDKVAEGWGDLRQEAISILQREVRIREVAEIVGAEGLQDEDRLLLWVAERIRLEFLCQNAFSEDGFSPLGKTYERMLALVEEYRNALGRLHEGATADEILERR